MSQKVKFLIIVTLMVVVAMAILTGVGFYRGMQPTLSVNPEIVLSSSTTGQTLLSFKLKITSSLPIWAVSLKTLGTSTAQGLNVPLDKQADGNFTASVQVPSKWTNKPETITFGLYVNGIKTANTARFAITDIPVTLPPDPGEAGKASLSGIDSDNDGIRDDLQREIVFMYPGNDQVRRLLRAMVKKEQDVITTTGDHEHFKGLMVSAFAFQDCYDYLVFSIGHYDPTNETNLWNMAKNTPERKLKYQANSDLASPFFSPTLPGSQACTQSLVQGQY